MDRIFQIGDFVFRLCCPAEITPPENFMKFECESESFEYTYQINVSDTLPDPEGKVIAQRPDLAVFRCETEAGESLECRLIGVKGNPEYYACYQEVSENCAEVTLIWERIAELHIDPIFTSLLALERRLVKRNSMILHCAYVEYQGEAILFSAPSETGKTTQANLWEKYRGSRTVNGDRSLLGKIDGRWNAQGWPVCGTSEVCNNEALPVKAVVMLSQAKENKAEKLTPGHAFPLLYSQITVNKWNREDHIHTMDLIEDFLGSVPVIHLECTISEEAVICLEEILQTL
nr:hypothetical protein [uncultured Mediterraneibacter sp.]